MRLISLFLLAVAVRLVASECPNACSGQGDCGAYDQCTCYRNWQGADCSLRTCPFGTAHVDSPKGDLDLSADDLSGPDKTILMHSTTYPHGTQEQFPNMTDSVGNLLVDSAHYYMECSNKGICDRMVGSCECFEGYEGSACQRASCPNDCSGHGTCEHIKTLAALSGGNQYSLWDADMTMGCSCDAGYSGPDCNERTCKLGIDPLYVDDDATARVESVTYRISVNTTELDEDGKHILSGSYGLEFFDALGEDYITAPIAVDADCTGVKSALESLPNKVVPSGTVSCTFQSESALGSDGVTMNLKSVQYSLTFRGNPGYLKQLEVETHLDGKRPTVYAHDSTQENMQIAQFPAAVTIFNTGMTGERTDYFATQCRNVYASIKAETENTGILATTTVDVLDFPELNSGFYLDGLDKTESKLLKSCLGDSDGNMDDNVEVYNWDYGSIVSFDSAKHRMMSSHPHAIKLVEVDPADGDFAGGMYYLTWWEPVQKKFILANFPSSSMIGKTFAVFATDGVVERVIIDRRYGFADKDDDAYEASDFGIGEINSGDHDYDGDGISERKDIDPRVTAYFTAASNVLYTSVDTACESADKVIEPCLKRGDMIFVIDSNYLTSSYDPSYNNGTTHPATYGSNATYESGNLYKIERIYTAAPTASTFSIENRHRIVLDKNIPFSGMHTTNLFEHLHSNTTLAPEAVGVVNLFKFTPTVDAGNYDYATPCSNRGTCNDGHCECFKGYTNDNCDLQSALAYSTVMEI